MTIATPPESGTRVFRWQEPQNNAELYYSAWYYFPTRYSVSQFWNVLQWKSKRSSGQTDPFFVLNVGNRPSGAMFFYLYDWQRRRSYSQNVADLPVGRWFKVEAYYACAADGTGQVTLWQDGTQLFDVTGRSTRYSDGDCQWSVDNYSDGVSPSPTTIYIDDAAITTGPSGGSSGTAAPPAPDPIYITTDSLPSGQVGTAYTTTLIATGGTTPYNWAVAGGQLPPGLSLSSKGLISGVPSSSGTYGASFRVTGPTGPLQMDTSAYLNVQIASAPAPSTGDVIWSADHETGDESQWYAPSTGPTGNYGGGEFNSGSGDTVASRDHAHSGQWGLRMTVSTPPESGTRMFRWMEPQTFTTLRYSAWYYFPRTYTVSQYWNVFQWKSKTSTGQIDPFFVLNVGNRSDGSMYFYLYDWQKRKSYPQSVLDVPVGRWFKMEAEYVCTSSTSGRVRFWQDEQLLFDVPNVQTRYSNGDCQWSVDNYSNELSPSPAVIYIDDAAITKP